MEIKSEDKVLAGLAHLAIFLNLFGILGTLVIYLVKKDESKFVSQHAKQALGYQLTLLVVGVLLSFLFFGGAIGGIFGLGMIGSGIMPSMIGSIMFIGAISTLVALAIHGYAIFASIKAFQGEDFNYILIGDYVNKF